MAHRALLVTSITIVAAAIFGGTADAQATAGPASAAPATATPAALPWNAPAVGAQAPDFELSGATRFGLLKTPVRLSDFRDKTVVLAFFAQARTKG